MLWRALHNVVDGFYIDVGAGDPDEDSVTRAFYDRGWHGINIEPSPEYFEALLAARPRDITLRCLAGAALDEAPLHHFAGTGLSTTDAMLAARHVAAGWDSDIIRLPVLSLTEIWRRHARPTVHFLKIDVEGAEAEVLRGADFSVFRPWIVLAEATEPGSPTENWVGWDGLLTGAEYRFSWFDGLNRFYVAAEYWDALKSAFAAPPNVFDQWIQPCGKQQRALLERGQAATVSALQAANTAHEAMRAAQAETGTVRGELAAAQARTKAAETETAELRNRLASAQADHAAAQAELHNRLASAQADHAAAQAELHNRLASAQADHAAARAQADQSHAALIAHEFQWRADVARLHCDLHQARLAREQAEAGLLAMYGSTSWRVTAPMRGIVDLARGLMRRTRATEAARAPATANTNGKAVAPPTREAAETLSPQQAAPGEPEPSRPAEEQRMLVRLRARSRAE